MRERTTISGGIFYHGVVCCAAGVAFASAGLAAQWESFEEGIPVYVSADHTDVSISTNQVKHGQKALRWRWQPGDEFTIRQGMGDLNRTGGYAGQYAKATFGLWYFVEQPIDANLKIEFRTGDRVKARLEASLDQPGWRRLHAWLVRDADGRIDPRTDTIRLIAPQSEEGGVLFLDLIVYNGLLDYRRHYIPKAAGHDHVRNDARLLSLATHIAPDAVAAVDDIADRVEQQILGSRSPREWVVLRTEIDATVQERASGDPAGPCLVADRDTLFYDGIDGIVPCSAVTRLLRDTAAHWRLHEDSSVREEAALLFVRLAQHLRYQGMRPHSGFDWNWYEGRDLVEACVLARELMAREGLLDWAIDYVESNYGLLNPVHGRPDVVDMDYFHLTATMRLHGALLLPNRTLTATYLQCYSEALTKNILDFSLNGLKPDGTAWHHGGPNLPYARYGLNSLAGIIETLSGTPFRIASDAHARVRDGLLAMRFYCNLRDAPLSLQGRHLFDEQATRLLSGSFWRMARAGRDGTRQILDAEMASAYLRLEPEEQSRDTFVQGGIHAEAHPQGHRAFPYGAFSAHRRDEWLAVVRGQSRYVWGSEIYADANRYGLYLGHGFLEILGGGTPVTLTDSGCTAPGWDWRRLDGTTAVDLPLSELRSPRQGTEFIESPSALAGGLAHQGRNGVFALRLGSWAARVHGLSARKSYFFFDDRIVCVGSSIACKHADYHVLTTLFQKFLDRPDTPVEVDGQSVTGFPTTMQLPAEGGHTIMDPQGTGYYVIDGGSLLVRRATQHSRDRADRSDTSGRFASAWIDHGAQPKQAHYAYIVLAKTSALRLAAFAQAMPSRSPPVILARRDGNVHAVWDRSTRLWALAIYSPVDDIQDSGVWKGQTERSCPLRGVRAPCLLVLEKSGNEGLVISVADPDLRLVDHVSHPQTVEIVLHGHWRHARARPQGVTCRGDVVEDTTTVRIECRWGQTRTIELRHAEPESLPVPLGAYGH